MAIITSGYVDLSIGTATRQALAPSTSAFNQYEEQARFTVIARCAVAGYSISTDSTNPKVKELVLGQWYLKALGYRKGMALPPLITEMVSELDKVESGSMPIPNASVNDRDAIGGVKFSATSKTASDGRFQYFSRKEMKGNW